MIKEKSIKNLRKIAVIIALTSNLSNMAQFELFWILIFKALIQTFVAKNYYQTFHLSPCMPVKG